MAENQEHKQIYVERETFESKGKTYFRYFIKGTVRGRDIKISIAPPDKDTDKGGYAVLDLVFGDSNKADFVLVPYEIRDDKTHKVIKGNSYIVRTVGEDGKVYECPVKPDRTSDKALLNLLLME